MTETDGTPLASLGIWPADAIERLAACWITSAEQVVAIAATSSGVPTLAQQAGLPEEELVVLVERTRQLMPSWLRDQLSPPDDTTRFGTGALPSPRTSKD